MYGTIARLNVQPGKFDELMQHMQSYDHLPIPGMVHTHVYRADSNPDECWVAVAFESKEAYHANAGSPDQNSRYEAMRSLLTADPEWHDGDIIVGIE